MSPRRSPGRYAALPDASRGTCLRGDTPGSRQTACPVRDSFRRPPRPTPHTPRPSSLMIRPEPTVLESPGIRLEPLQAEHAEALVRAASDGKLWELWYTTVPSPDNVAAYVETALAGQAAGHM